MIDNNKLKIINNNIIAPRFPSLEGVGVGTKHQAQIPRKILPYNPYLKP
jgi:hypothetical protein